MNGLGGVAAARVDADAAGSLRCDVVPADPDPSLLRYLEACASEEDQLWSLPGGAPVFATNGHELAYMAWEQGDRDTYRLGALDPTDAVVVDAGANIGLFSLLAASRSPSTTVFSVEPIAPLAALLQRTARLHGCADRVTTLTMGLGSHEETATFRYAPFLAALSSRHLQERASVCRRLVIAINVLLPRLAPGSDLDLGQAREWISEQLQESELEVRVTTLSTLLRELDVDRIDLLKVDVEGSELEVLDGIDAGDWDRIGRLALEVNDLDGRLQKVEDRLRAHGFDVTTEDDSSASRAVPSKVAMVHGSRRPLGPRAEDGPMPRLATRRCLSAPASRLIDAVQSQLAELGVGACTVRLRARLDAGDESGWRQAPFLEELCRHLSQLLGVPPIELDSGWRDGGLLVPAAAGAEPA